MAHPEGEVQFWGEFFLETAALLEALYSFEGLGQEELQQDKLLIGLEQTFLQIFSLAFETVLHHAFGLQVLSVSQQIGDEEGERFDHILL